MHSALEHGAYTAAFTDYAEATDRDPRAGTPDSLPDYVPSVHSAFEHGAFTDRDPGFDDVSTVQGYALSDFAADMVPAVPLDTVVGNAGKLSPSEERAMREAKDAPPERKKAIYMSILNQRSSESQAALLQIIKSYDPSVHPELIMDLGGIQGAIQRQPKSPPRAPRLDRRQDAVRQMGMSAVEEIFNGRTARQAARKSPKRASPKQPARRKKKARTQQTQKFGEFAEPRPIPGGGRRAQPRPDLQKLAQHRYSEKKHLLRAAVANERGAISGLKLHELGHHTYSQKVAELKDVTRQIIARENPSAELLEEIQAYREQTMSEPAKFQKKFLRQEALIQSTEEAEISEYRKL